MSTHPYAGNVILKLLTLAPICKRGHIFAQGSSFLDGRSSSSFGLSNSGSSSGGGGSSRVVAKVTDFGLSAPLDPYATHISQMHGVSPGGALSPAVCMTMACSAGGDASSLRLLAPWSMRIAIFACQQARRGACMCSSGRTRAGHCC